MENAHRPSGFRPRHRRDRRGRVAHRHRAVLQARRKGSGIGAARLGSKLGTTNQPPASPPGVDQLLGRQPRPRTQVRQVTFDGARPDAHDFGRVWDGSASGNEGCEDVQLPSGGWPPRPSAGHIIEPSTPTLDSAIGPPAARGATCRVARAQLRCVAVRPTARAKRPTECRDRPTARALPRSDGPVGLIGPVLEWKDA